MPARPAGPAASIPDPGPGWKSPGPRTPPGPGRGHGLEPEVERTGLRARGTRGGPFPLFPGGGEAERHYRASRPRGPRVRIPAGSRRCRGEEVAPASRRPPSPGTSERARATERASGHDWKDKRTKPPRNGYLDSPWRCAFPSRRPCPVASSFAARPRPGSKQRMWEVMAGCSARCPRGRPSARNQASSRGRSRSRPRRGRGM
jgi:hypothetical protein